MSTSLASKTLAPTQRITEAGAKAAQQLHREDGRLMAAALAEMAFEEVIRNPSFAVRVLGRYDELVSVKPRRTIQKTERPSRVDLVPIREIPGREIDLSAPPDPYFLLDLYGSAQLAAALNRHTTVNLRPAVATVKQRNPGTRPSGSSKSALIEYIVRYVM